METALNTPKVSFEDFYEVPDLKFDIDRFVLKLDIAFNTMSKEIQDYGKDY